MAGGFACLTKSMNCRKFFFCRLLLVAAAAPAPRATAFFWGTGPTDKSILASIPKRRFMPPITPSQPVPQLNERVKMLEEGYRGASGAAEQLLVGEWRVAYSDTIPICSHVAVPSGYVAGSVYTPWLLDTSADADEWVQVRRSIMCKKLGPEKVERREESVVVRRSPAGIVPADITYLSKKMCIERVGKTGSLTVLERSTIPSWLSRTIPD